MYLSLSLSLSIYIYILYISIYNSLNPPAPPLQGHPAADLGFSPVITDYIITDYLLLILAVFAVVLLTVDQQLSCCDS